MKFNSFVLCLSLFSYLIPRQGPKSVGLWKFATPQPKILLFLISVCIAFLPKNFFVCNNFSLLPSLTPPLADLCRCNPRIKRLRECLGVWVEWWWRIELCAGIAAGRSPWGTNALTEMEKKEKTWKYVKLLKISNFPLISSLSELSELQSAGFQDKFVWKLKFEKWLFFCTYCGRLE